MPISMDKVYSIMHYLSDSYVDRIYPVDITELSSFQGSSKVMPLNNHSFNDITEVQFLIRVLTDDDSLKGTEKEFDVSCSFCMDTIGKTPIYEFEPTSIVATYGEKYLVSFKFDWDEVATRDSHKLTGVHSLKFDLSEDVYRCFVHKVIFRYSDYRYTLEDIAQAYEDGQNYVRDKLNDSKILRNITDIPRELERYVYMCAGAFAWLIVWEYESKPMKELKSESNNYADRLFGTVDKAIANYLKTMENDPNADYIKPYLSGTSKVSWGIGL